MSLFVIKITRYFTSDSEGINTEASRTLCLDQAILDDPVWLSLLRKSYNNVFGDIAPIMKDNLPDLREMTKEEVLAYQKDCEEEEKAEKHAE